MVYNKPGAKIKVIFGGGRTKFLPNTTYDYDGFQGERADGKNLITDWAKDKSNAKVIYDKSGLDQLDVKNTDYALGLFAPGHLEFHLDANNSIQPRLMDMMEVAIKILQKEENGFYLFVEGK